jgi:short subunit dehydrogenase-like uncharacterized protein
MLVLYGATGYTGRLVAHELATAGDEFVLSGRDRTKLDALAAELEDTNAVRPDVRVADATDPAALRSAFDGASAVISAAGPFSRFGLGVVAAAVDAGAHYCDTTGEPAFQLAVEDRFAAAPVTVVPACGFDYVPHDLAAAAAVAALDGDVDRVETALSVESFGTSRGTKASALGAVADPMLEWTGGSWQPARAGADVRTFAFGDRDAPAVLYPGGDAVQIRLHTGARTIRTWFVLPGRSVGVARVVAAGMRRGSLLSHGPLRAGLERLVDRAEEGPSDDRRRAARFAVLAEATGPGGTRRAMSTGTDVYGLTAVVVARIGRLLADDGGVPRGVRAPADVVGDPFAFAADCGFRLDLVD